MLEKGLQTIAKGKDDMGSLKKLPAIILERTIQPFNSANSEVIIALAFGQRPTPSDDKINQALAQIVREEYLRTKLPIIAQREIANHLTDLDPISINEHRKKGQYLDTLEVLSQAHDQGYKKITLVAHPDHLWRTAQVAKKLEFEITGIANTRSVGYDNLSTQKWTKSRLRFVPYDTLARLVYLKNGWI